MHSILAVDDSASMRQMVSFTLKNAGFNVTEAVDGIDAWEKSLKQDYALVLTDQNMPRLDGIGLTRKLRENPNFKNTPILILTTESSDQMKQACFIWSLDSVVRIRMGVFLKFGFSLSFRVSPIPSSLGMFWSVSTRA